MPKTSTVLSLPLILVLMRFSPLSQLTKLAAIVKDIAPLPHLSKVVCWQLISKVHMHYTNPAKPILFEISSEGESRLHYSALCVIAIQKRRLSCFHNFALFSFALIIVLLSTIAHNKLIHTMKTAPTLATICTMSSPLITRH